MKLVRDGSRFTMPKLFVCEVAKTKKKKINHSENPKFRKFLRNAISYIN